jgi:hypothetical protein
LVLFDAMQFFQYSKSQVLGQYLNPVIIVYLKHNSPMNLTAGQFIWLFIRSVAICSSSNRGEKMIRLTLPLECTLELLRKI